MRDEIMKCVKCVNKGGPCVKKVKRVLITRGSGSTTTVNLCEDCINDLGVYAAESNLPVTIKVLGDAEPDIDQD
jgi:hypothetical protein